MSTFNVSLVNLPKKLEIALSAKIQAERLGSFQCYASATLAQHFSSGLNGTNLVIAYDTQLSQDSLYTLNTPENIPVILISANFDFEMERTALANNINLVIDEHNAELTQLVINFIQQFKIYQHHHALIIDDSRVDSAVIEKVLSHEFIHTSIEHDPDKVIERISEDEKISVLILDYQMPNINGCELMAVIKQHFKERAFIIIGLTGHRNGALQFLHQGANNAFLKPIDAELFTLTLRKLIFNFHHMQQQSNTLMNYRNILNKISHDIRNPIYVLMNLNDLFLENQINRSSREQVEKLSQTAKENISHIFEDLLGYIEVTTYKQPPHLKNCSLNSIIASQLFLESHQAKLKNIMMNQHCDGEATILCVPNQIELVITNLTNNAVKYSEKDSTVDIRLFKEKNDIIFEVEDSSPPIPEENYQHFFQSYKYQHHPQKEIDTQALGLTFCKEIIEAHGGVIGIRSGERGNIFYFKLPSDHQQTTFTKFH